MIVINKYIDTFLIITDRTTISAPTIKSLVDVLEKELDITIYARGFEVELDDLEDKLENQEEAIKELRTKYELLKKNSKNTEPKS